MSAPLTFTFREIRDSEQSRNAVIACMRNNEGNMKPKQVAKDVRLSFERSFRVVLAESQGETAGYIAYRLNVAVNDEPRYVYIRRLFVSKAYQRKGLASQLLGVAYAAAKAEDRGRALPIKVHADSDAARATFVANGFANISYTVSGGAHKEFWLFKVPVSSIRVASRSPSRGRAPAASASTQRTGKTQSPSPKRG